MLISLSFHLMRTSWVVETAALVSQESIAPVSHESTTSASYQNLALSPNSSVSAQLPSQGDTNALGLWGADLRDDKLSQLLSKYRKRQ